MAPAEKPPSPMCSGSTGTRRKVDASAASMKARSAPKSPWVKFQLESRLAQAEFSRAERFRAYRAEEAFRKAMGKQRPSLVRRLIGRLEGLKRR